MQPPRLSLSPSSQTTSSAAPWWTLPRSIGTAASNFRASTISGASPPAAMPAIRRTLLRSRPSAEARTKVSSSSPNSGFVMLDSTAPSGEGAGLSLHGLTQVLIWAVLLLGILFGISLFAAGKIDPAQQAAANEMLAAQGMSQETLMEYGEQIAKVFNPGTILLFMFYFLGGFFLYGSLFAAVGSGLILIRTGVQTDRPGR